MDAKTSYTPEEVTQLILQERLKERMTSWVLTSIQRSEHAGDDPVYIEAGKLILREIIGVPQEQPKEPPVEESKPE